MALVRGITVLDLIAALPPGLQGFIPANIAQFIELLAIVDHRTHTAGRFYIHHGRVQSAVDAGLQLPAGFPLIIPGLNRGVNFQFTHDRTALNPGPVPPADNLEPAETIWQLDLFLDQVGIPLPFVMPANRVDSEPAKPGHLVRDTTRDTVQLIGSGVLRIAGGPAGPTVALIAPPNPIAPTDPIGTVIEFNLAPKHMLLHDSGLGMTIDRVVWDDSTNYTPPEIEARSHDATWTGLAIKEASVYLPRDLPVFGDVSLGVRDLILGFNPPGFQGEAAIELGRPLLSAAFQFFQDSGQGPVAATVTSDGRNRDVILGVNAGSVARVYARCTDNALTVQWQLPGSTSWFTAQQTPWFTVTPDSEGAVLRMRERITQGTDTFDGAEYQFHFKRSADPNVARPRPPKLGVTPQGGTAQSNVTSLSGAAASLQGIGFTASASPPPAAADQARWTWLLRHAGNEFTATGASFTPQVAWQPGRHRLRLTDHLNQTRHLEIDVVAAGGPAQLVIGCEAGVKDSAGAAIPITQLEGSYSLDSFHESGARAATTANATLAGGVVTVPAGSLAEVALQLQSSNGGGETIIPTPLRKIRHVRVLMEFDRTEPLFVREYREIVGGDAWGQSEPYPYVAGDGNALPTENTETPISAWATGPLARWTATLPAGTRFVVIGRCCDVGSATHNQNLGRDRAEHGRDLLRGLPLQSGVITDAQIYYRGEQTVTGTGTAPTPAEFPSPAAQTQLTGRTGVEWRITNVYNAATRARFTGNGQPERKEYRGVDIFAVFPDPAQQPSVTSDGDALAANRRRALVPGADTTQAVVVPPREPEVGFRLQILAKWDSPTFVDARDAIPTMLQLTLDWQTQNLPVPSQGGNVIPQATSGTTPMVYQLIGRLSYDPRSGDTVISIAIDTPGDDRGLFDLVKASGNSADAIAGKVFATALAIGPALLGGISPADPGGAAVRIGALLTACGFVVATDLVSDGLATVQRFEIEQHLHAPEDGTGSKTKLMVDYTVSLTINNQFVQSATPVKVRYKNVGILIDNAETGLDALQFIYEDTDFEIVDPGRWTMQGVLGELLGVTEVRIGAGSVWFEIDLAFSLDLGVVEVTKATVRLIITNGNVSFELRGLAARVEVPGVVEGGGQLQVGAAGDISAAIDLTIIPAEISAWAALVYKKPMTQLAAGVQFATAIPLASTGLGIYGFMGRFVSNGTRLLPANPDPVERELAWYRAPELSKYTPMEGQFALGLGAIVGTLPDAGFSFNAVGMLAIEFPDPSVVFGIDAKFISKPEGQPKEQGDANASSFQMLGVIAVDEDGLVIGVRGSYKIPKLLEVLIPAGAYFPFGDTPGDAYVRVGSDGEDGRTGDPVTMTILPGLLDQKCWAYFMVEERKLHKLGGDPDFQLDGFSIGFGAGWGFKWGGGPIYLRASAAVYVGLGTRPFVLMGKVKVEGELRLIIVSVSVSGEITVRLADNGSYLKGKFCGKVSFLFFDIEGCVEFTIQGGSDPPPPNPGPLVSAMSLADPYARVTAVATDGVPGPANTAWPDTCPVLRFDHRVGLALQAGSFQPSPSNGWPGNDWSGSTRLKFLYRLESIRLLENGVPLTTDDWVSVWWLATFREGLPAADQPASSEHEGWDLALLHWDLAPWSRNLPAGGAGIPADPAQSIGQICDPPPPVSRGCVVGEKYTRLLSDRVRLAPFKPGPQPYPSDFLYTATEGLYPESLSFAVTQAIDAGRQFTPGQQVALPQPWGPPGEDPMKLAYRLPYTSSAGASFHNLSIDGDFDQLLVQPEAWLGLHLKMPAPGALIDRCVTFAGFKPGTKPAKGTIVDGVTFVDLGGTAIFVDVYPNGKPDGIAELRFSAKALRATLPSVTDHVAAYVGLVKPPDKFSEGYIIVMEAYDIQGVLLGTASTPDTTGALTRLEINAKGIASVILRQGAENGYLQRLCFWEKGPIDPNYKEIAYKYFESLKSLPVVQGVFTDGTTDGWLGEKKDLLLNGDTAVLLLRYAPYKQAAPYAGLRVLPYKAGPRVLVLTICAFTQKALDDHAADQQAHDDLGTLVDDAVNGAEEDRHRLLKPDTEYTVEIGYTVAAWQPTDDTELKPPTVSSFNWTAGGSIHVFSNQKNSFKFRTAAGGTLQDKQVLSPEVQSTFDPRAVARYLICFDPATTQPSHFLDDDLRVFFDVEWVPTLLERYGRKLELRVQRTDPPPGANAPDVFTAVPISPLGVLWKTLPMELLPVADQRIAEAIEQAPCLPDKRPPQGATGSVTGPLAPDVDYDFIAGAVLIDAPHTEVVIGRSHLHTSRYRNPADLITAVGFTSPRVNTATPIDALLPAGAVIPDLVELTSDARLDAGLTQLGLDPWPLPREPRTCLLWRLDGGVWKLAGVLLDSDEAMVRAKRIGEEEFPRMTLVRCRVHGTNLELTPRRSNVAGTRVLFAPTGSTNPIALPAGDLALDLEFTDNGAAKLHSRTLSAVPSLILKETQP
jgi:hypothetical protein